MQDYNHAQRSFDARSKMGRIRSEITIDGKSCWTLFDSGARNNCITEAAAEGFARLDLSAPKMTALGGREHVVRQVCLVMAEIERRPVEFHADVIDEIGKDEDGRPIDVLFGALAMQEWGIRLDLQNERLDLSRYTRDFVEF
jgi:hypothetical protein